MKIELLRIILSSIFFISACYSNSIAAPIITYEQSTGDILVGSDFYLNVFASGVTETDSNGLPDEVLCFGFDVNHNNSQLDYNGATIGPGFFDDSKIFPDTDVAGMAFPGISGNNILLASLSFTPHIAGEFYIDIASDLSDPNEGLYTFLHRIDLKQKINLTAATPVPGPGTIFLFGGGILGLIVSSRKNRLINTSHLKKMDFGSRSRRIQVSNRRHTPVC